LLSHATRILAERTSLLAVTTTDAGDVYYAGMSHLFAKDELLNINLSRTLLELLDQAPYWEAILRQFYKLDQDIMCMLGEEDFRNVVFEPLASVFGEFNTDKVKGFIGVIGPNRMYFDTIIPQVRYSSHLLEEILKDQQ
jgi:heat-inducible transcriptional repressor